MGADTPVLTMSWARLSPEARPPVLASGCVVRLASSQSVQIGPLERALVSTGIACALPDGCAGLAIPQGGCAPLMGFTFTNTPGLIDCGYRGQIALIVQNIDAATWLSIEPGTVLADMLVMPTATVPLPGGVAMPPCDLKGNPMDDQSGTLDVHITCLEDDMPLPAYAHQGDNGLDLHAAHDAVLEPLGRTRIRFGVGIGLPHGTVGLVQPRSGLAARTGLSIVGSPLLVFPGDDAELSAMFVNTDAKTPIRIARGDRIAQLVVVRVPRLRLQQVDRLDDTQRGAGGFGSSGT